MLPALVKNPINPGVEVDMKKEKLRASVAKYRARQAIERAQIPAPRVLQAKADTDSESESDSDYEEEGQYTVYDEKYVPRKGDKYHPAPKDDLTERVEKMKQDAFDYIKTKPSESEMTNYYNKLSSKLYVLLESYMNYPESIYRRLDNKLFYEIQANYSASM